MQASRLDWMLAALVLVVSFAAFANSIGNGFVYDDEDVIAKNPRVATFDLKTILTTPYWTGEGAQAAGLYRPATIGSFALERVIFGEGPKPVHATNVVLNALAAMLAFFFTLRLLGSRFVAVAAGLLWGAHSLHAEVVANGVGRSELLAALGVFGGLLLHFAWLRARTEAHLAVHARNCLLGAMACFFAGLMAKESAVALPALAFLADLLVVEKGRLRATLERLPAYFAYLVPFALYMFARSAVVGSGTPAVQEVMGKTTGFERVLHASETLFRQVGQSLAPAYLCGEYADYRSLLKPSLADPMVLASLVAWMGLAGLLWFAWKRGRAGIVFAAAWFFVAILPVSNVLFPIGTVRADRLVFVPSFGIVLVVALLLGEVETLKAGVGKVLLLILLVPLMLRTWDANREWASLDVFWKSTLKKNPGSPIAWAHAGEEFRKAGDKPAAEAAFQKAIDLRDGLGFFHAAAHTNLGELMADRGDVGSAEQQYRMVLLKEPKRFVALLNLGELLLRAPTTPERLDEARTLLALATAVDAKDFRGFANLAQAHVALRRFDDALVAARRARELKPDIPDLWAVEGEILTALGRQPEADAAFAEYRRRGAR